MRYFGCRILSRNANELLMKFHVLYHIFDFIAISQGGFNVQFLTRNQGRQQALVDCTHDQPMNCSVPKVHYNNFTVPQVHYYCSVPKTDHNCSVPKVLCSYGYGIHSDVPSSSDGYGK